MSTVASPAASTPVGTKRVGSAAPAAPAAVAGAAPATNPDGTPVVKRGGGLSREVFDFTTAVNSAGKPVHTKAADGKVLLTALPANYDVRKHKALEKTDFTSDQEGEASFYDYKAAVSDSMVRIYQKSTDDYRAQASNVRKFGNVEQRKLANKAAAMVNEFQALLDQMRKEGVDTKDLEAMLNKPKA